MSAKESVSHVVHDVLIKSTDPTFVKAGTPILAIFGIPLAQITEMVNGYGTVITTILGIVACIYLIVGRHLANERSRVETEGERLKNEAVELANEEARLKIQEMHRTVMDAKDSIAETNEKVNEIADAVHEEEKKDG